MANDPTDTTKYPLGTNDLYVAARNASDFDKGLSAGNTTFVNRFGKTLPTFEKAISDAKASYGGLNNRGDWVTATNYAVNDLWQSTVDDTWYLVLTAYTSGADESADIASGNVQVFQGIARQDAVIKIASVFDIDAFSRLEEGDAVELIGYHPDTTVGGGNGVVKSARHNGGTAISLTRARPTDWTDQAQLTAWFADSGSDELCFVKESKSIISVSSFGAKQNGVDDDSLSAQKALDSHVEVAIDGECVCNTMITINTRKTLRILSNAAMRRLDVNNTDPVVWLNKSQASLIGTSFSASSITSAAKSPKGIVRIGHKDMTESHDNVNYCTFSGVSLVGAQIYGQGSGDPDIALYVPNPQFGGLTSYFHTISDIKMQYANYGLVLEGYANANIIRGLQGIQLGNAITSEGAMIWLKGALDNVIQGAFFHSSLDSIMLKLTNLDNSANGGVQHSLYANSMTGLVAEQGGSNARGVWTDTGGSKQFIEMRHNVAGGNIFPSEWGDDGVFFGLQGGRGVGSLIVEGDGTGDARYKFVADGRYLHDTESIASPNPAKHQFKGSINVDQKTTKVFNGTSNTDMRIAHSIAQNGSSYKYVSLNLKISAYSGGGALAMSEYSVPLGGLSTWGLGTPTKIHGSNFTIVDYGSDNATSYIRIENPSGYFMTVEATVMGYFTATFVD